MANNLNNKTADWEPGTLDKTRRAIGSIDPTEAASMAKKLGGEILNEKPSSNPQGNAARRPVAVSSRTQSNRSSSQQYMQKTVAPTSQTQSKRRRKSELQSMNIKLCTAIDKLMMSEEYQIKQNYGFFNFIRKFQKDGTEKIIPSFYSVTLKHHIHNLESFITVIKMLIQIAPNTYKAKIVNGSEAKFKFLRMVAGWTIKNIKYEYSEIQYLEPPIIVSDLVPLIRAIYTPIMMIYYYGPTKIPKLIKEIYTDEIAYPDANKEKISSLAKEAITQWLYIDTEIIKKLYPLLMRMCSNTYEVYPSFFTTKIADILKFIGLHKFDLLLPEKKKEEVKPVAKKTVPDDTRGKRDEVVNTGLNLLDKLFPKAGFKSLDSHPDLYPYFQPLYKFDDGFNVLSPENPMQVTIVLVRILEDFFHGCRTIVFSDGGKMELDKKRTDSINSAIDDWSAYREDVFGKLYGEPLSDYVNQIYSQSDFRVSSYGKKSITAIMWQAKYHFLPHFKFESLVLDRPLNDSKYPQLYYRTDFLRKYLTSVVNACDVASSAKGDVESVKNPWEHYKFDIPNEISKRLDVLLCAQNTTASTNATNANLLKYTLCVVSVLDWWINNKDSPAYSTDPSHIYRVSAEDGKPQFSVPERTDQNKLFAEEIKAAYKQ